MLTKIGHGRAHGWRRTIWPSVLLSLWSDAVAACVGLQRKRWVKRQAPTYVTVKLDRQVSSELISREQSERRALLAKRTRDVAERSALAQRERYTAGAAIALEVRAAEDQLRRAELSPSRARVDVALARVRLSHLAGDLLVKVAPQIAL